MSKSYDLIICKLFSKAITITSVAFDRILANKLLFKEKLGVPWTDINLDKKRPLLEKYRTLISYSLTGGSGQIASMAG